MSNANKIYERMVKFGIIDESGKPLHSYMKFHVEGSESMLPFVIEHLYDNRYSLSHYGVQNGDLMSDPDVEVEIDPETKTANAKTFRNDYVGVDQRPDPITPAFQKELNAFTADWLKTTMDIHKYTLKESKPEEDEDE